MVSHRQTEGCMTAIDPNADLVTLINVFTVAPENQQRLLDLLAEATTEIIAGMPGFVSANLHRGLDGTRVANYAQWRSRQDMEAMLAHPAAADHLRAVAALAIAVEPRLYEVAFVANAPTPMESVAEGNAS